MTTRTALVTEASDGIGKATALDLTELGYTVYGAARRIDRLQVLAAAGVRPLAIDVTDDASMQAGVSRIITETGRIDVLVNNAGYGSYGALEDVPLDQGRYQFDVNVFGAFRLAQLVLPHMRAQRTGRIINITSMGGKRRTPLSGWYHGSKHALEALSESLRLETKPFGIDVVTIEPGGIKAEWGGISADNVENTSGGGPYAAQAESMATQFRSDTIAKRSSPHSVIAKLLGKAVTAHRPKARYVAGFGTLPLFFTRRRASDRIFDWVM